MYEICKWRQRRIRTLGDAAGKLDVVAGPLGAFGLSEINLGWNSCSHDRPFSPLLRVFASKVTSQGCWRQM